MSPINKDYDKKIFRLVYILNRLDSMGKVSTRDLVNEFNVTPRTVQRDIELLNTAGFPLTRIDKGIHAFFEGFSLRRVMLSTKEASLLSFLCDISRSLGKDFESSFSTILGKVLGQTHESAFYMKVPNGIKTRKSLPFLSEIETAIEECQKIDLRYAKGQSEKVARVDPLKILFFDGFWYLLARVKGQEWLRKFSWENIKGVSVLEKNFIPPSNLKSILDTSTNAWFSEKHNIKVVLNVSSEVAMYFMRKKYFPAQKIMSKRKDGSLIIEAKVGRSMEVLPSVLFWMPYVKVISPKELKDEVRDVVNDYRKCLLK